MRSLKSTWRGRHIPMRRLGRCSGERFNARLVVLNELNNKRGASGAKLNARSDLQLDWSNNTLAVQVGSVARVLVDQQSAFDLQMKYVMHSSIRGTLSLIEDT